jgi:hypothetical protein
MNTSSLSRSLRLVLASVATFGVGVLLGLSAEAQPRTFGHRGLRRPVVVQAPVVHPAPPPVVFRHHRMRMNPAPVYVQPAPVYVQPAPVIVRPAPVVPRDEHGILVIAGTRLYAGQALRAQWGAGWFDAQVIAVEPNGVRIHYTGYGDSWNEVVPLYRLRIAG